MNAKVLLAVFKRNFLAYFTSPTGYVFICVFVLLSSIAAFMPDEFFNRNLANLDQLNQWFPFIMLVFVPAITMGIWADERRQGTDELLLTIPASDLDVVFAKYLAAVAIYTVSLVFSMICNLAVLNILGQPDIGLFIGTYIGYWLVGLAMLAVGMVASFVTSNLTIAYILGALFNAPLIALIWADSILPDAVGLAMKNWSIGEQLAEFGRGILSFSHMLYFVTLVAVMLYLSMVFISARHWKSGASSASRYLLYGLQIGALLVVGLNLCVLFGRFDVRADVTSEQLSSLSPDTVSLLKKLDPEQPVQIEAFISPQVPESYVQTRLDILNRLREIKARAGSKVILRIIPTERYTEEAARAEQRYGIQPERVFSTRRGRFSEESIFLGVAFTCGLEKVIVPFIDRGIPVEYELVRSLATVTQQERMKVGVLKTDAGLFGQMNMQMMGSSPNWPIIDELEKQYEVVEVDPAAPIEERFDVLLAVQPSSLTPEQMENFLAVVRSGQPTAIFEDPFPRFAPNVPGTTAPKQPPGGPQAMMMGQRPEPKGDVQPLWDMLGVDFGARNIVWQEYNPIDKLRDVLPEQFVFVDRGQGKESEPFSQTDPVTSGLQQLLFVFPGYLSGRNATEMEFEVLAQTGTRSGVVDVPMMFFGMGQIDPKSRRSTGRQYVLAARIQGPLPEEPEADEPPADDGGEESAEAEGDEESADREKKQDNLDVILVADLDMIHGAFFELRRQGTGPDAQFELTPDNVTFVLNVLDSLAGDDRFIAIRKRRAKHRTLTAIEQRTKDSLLEMSKEAEEAQKEFDKFVEEEEEKLEAQVEKLKETWEAEKVANLDIITQASMVQESGQRRLAAQKKRLQAELDRTKDRIETEMTLEIDRVQNTYKLWAVLLPPILPLLIAVIVFLTRRLQEKEGVSESRLR